MKKRPQLLLSILSLLLLTHCQTPTEQSKEQKTLPEEKSTQKKNSITKDSSSISCTFYDCKYSQEDGISYCQLCENLTALPQQGIQAIVKKLNDQYKTQFRYQQQQGDTLFIQLEEAYYITEQMGSYGAAVEMGKITHFLSQLEEVQVIQYDLTDGSHFSKGSYAADYFDDYVRFVPN